MLLAQGPVWRTPGNCCYSCLTVVLSVAAGPLPTFALFWEAQSPYARMCEGQSLVLNRPCFPWEASGQLTNQVRQDKL